MWEGIDWNIFFCFYVIQALERDYVAQPCGAHINTLLKRPGVAGAFLQTPLSLIKLMSESAHSSKSSENVHSQTIRNFEKRFTSPHLSCVKCHVSFVKCHLSRVRCHMSCITKKKMLLDGLLSTGLPRLIFGHQELDSMKLHVLDTSF